MKNIFLSILVIIISLFSTNAFSQSENDQELLGLPGDNLDLYAVLNLFQQSKTIEDFEKSLNEEKTGINNLDLDNDGKVDFIKVVTENDGDDFLFILQDAISKNETQDIAVISVAKDKEGAVSMQIIGDKDLYGKNYIVEPATKATAAVTANPGYTGDEPVESVPASTTVVVVESAPVVQYVYSPAYVPYYPPYYYGYYPPYYRAFTVMAVGIYRHNNYYHHHGYHGYHGGHGNTVVINNNKQINHYNNSKRNSSNTVNNNVKSGNYNTSGKAGTRPSTSQTGKASASSRPSTSQTNRSTGSSSTSTRPSTTQSKSPSASTRPSSSYSSGSRTRSSSPSYSRPSTTPTRSMSRGGGGRRRF